MDKFLIIILFLMAITVIVAPPYAFTCFKFLSRIRWFSKKVARDSEQIKQQALNCRVKLKEEKKDNSNSDTFNIEISGLIQAADSVESTVLKISILDITDEFSQAKPVYDSTEEPQMSDSVVYCYQSTLGKLPDKLTTISQWMSIAQLNVETLNFPHMGTRNLQMNASIFANSESEQLACTTCTFLYENPKSGYIDISENNQRAKTLAVPIAFAIGATDSKLSISQTATIKNWEKNNLYTPQIPDNAITKFKEALERAVSFFYRRSDKKIYKSCCEITRIASVGVRYDIIYFFLCVTRAGNIASAGQLTLLKKLVNWLEVDHERFRSMRERILPAHLHEVENIDDILGIYPEMNKGQIRKHLNHEYRKWNAITVSCNSEIQAQATHMLKLIGEARSQYIGHR